MKTISVELEKDELTAILQGIRFFNEMCEHECIKNMSVEDQQHTATLQYHMAKVVRKLMQSYENASLVEGPED